MSSFALILGEWEIALLIAWPTAWGLGFATWERFYLAPRRKLSSGIPAFVAGIIPSCLAFTGFESSSSIVESALPGIGLFIACSVSAFVMFLASRYLLRTRFNRIPSGDGE
jgi:hypothetical protein